MSEAEKLISEMAEQVTAFDAFEALRFGNTTERGAKFIELYGEACKLRGYKVERGDNGAVNVTPKRIKR